MARFKPFCKCVVNFLYTFNLLFFLVGDGASATKAADIQSTATAEEVQPVFPIEILSAIIREATFVPELLDSRQR